VLTDVQLRQLMSAALFAYTDRLLADQTFINENVSTRPFYNANLAVTVLGTVHYVNVHLEGKATRLQFDDDEVLLDNVTFDFSSPVLEATANGAPFTVQLLGQTPNSVHLSMFGTDVRPVVIYQARAPYPS
jgi:hypothetical protein